MRVQSEAVLACEKQVNSKVLFRSDVDCRYRGLKFFNAVAVCTLFRKEFGALRVTLESHSLRAKPFTDAPSIWSAKVRLL